MLSITITYWVSNLLGNFCCTTRTKGLSAVSLRLDVVLMLWGCGVLSHREGWAVRDGGSWFSSAARAVTHHVVSHWSYFRVWFQKNYLAFRVFQWRTSVSFLQESSNPFFIVVWASLIQVPAGGHVVLGWELTAVSGGGTWTNDVRGQVTWGQKSENMSLN